MKKSSPPSFVTWHGDDSVKAKFIRKLKNDIEKWPAKYSEWDMAGPLPYSDYPAAIGLPQWLGELTGSILPYLPHAQAEAWPLTLMEAIPCGMPDTVLTNVLGRFMYDLLTQKAMVDFSKENKENLELGKGKIDTSFFDSIVQLFKTELTGPPSNIEDWFKHSWFSIRAPENYDNKKGVFVRNTALLAYASYAWAGPLKGQLAFVREKLDSSSYTPREKVTQETLAEVSKLHPQSTLGPWFVQSLLGVLSKEDIQWKAD